MELIDNVVRFIRTGVFMETATACAGIAKQTFYTWMRQANELQNKMEKAKSAGGKLKLCKHEKLLLEFLDAVDRAAAEAELSDVVTIKLASATNWQAAAWRLERRNPGQWGRRDYVKNEVSGPNGGPVQVTTGLNDEEQAALLQRHFERTMNATRHSPAGPADQPGGGPEAQASA